jgi:hypothetical protein
MAEFSCSRIDTDRSAFQRLTQWFANHAASGKGRHDILPWFPLLQQLHQIRNPRPRQRTTVQQFMLDHCDTVNAAFVSKHSDGAGLTNVQRLNLRYSLAKKMLSKSYPHLKLELDKKAVVQYDIELKEWELVLEDITSTEDISRYVFFLFLDFVGSRVRP